MADDKVSKSGIWFDTDKRKVVDGDQPENAIQLVAPGQAVDANAQVVIDNWSAVDAGKLETAEDLSVGVETAVDPSKTVTTKATARK